jgi:hypothetical protein
MSLRRRFEVARARARKLLSGRAVPSLIALFSGAALLGWLLKRRPRPRPVPRRLMWGRQQVQLPGDGYGALFHRRYWVEIDRPKLGPRALMDLVKCDVGGFCPRLLADFTKSKGHPTLMQPGDEYKIVILGPWNGAVRVVEVKPASFTFVTLEGHPEAGQITFSARRHITRPRTLRFEIRSWARSRDMLVSLGYNEGKIGKEIQKNAWVAFCERVAEASGGTIRGEVQVATEEQGAKGEVVPVV